MEIKISDYLVAGIRYAFAQKDFFYSTVLSDVVRERQARDKQRNLERNMRELAWSYGKE